MMSYNQLVDKNYQYGSIKRKYYQGYNSYYQMFFDNIYMDLTTENRIIVDEWMRKQLEDKEPQLYKAYIQDVDTYMAHMTGFNEKTDEEIYSDLQVMRDHYIPKEQLLDSIYKKLQNQSMHTHPQPDIEDLIFYNQTNCKRKTAIDETDRYNQLLRDNEAIIIVPESYEQLIHLVSYMKTIQDQVNKIFILLKEKPDLYMATQKYFQAVMDSSLCELMNQGILEWITDTSTCYGFHYGTLDEESKQAIAPYIEKDTIFVLAFGEHSLLGIKNFNVDSIVMTTIDSWRARELTLLVDESYNYAIVYIPRHFNIYAYVPHNEKSILTYYQLSQISRLNRYNHEEYKDLSLLYRKYPQFFFNIYSLEEENQGLKAMDYQHINDYEDFIIKKNNALMEHINRGNLHVNYRKQYYNLDTLELTPYNPFPENNQACVTIDGILVDGKMMAEVKKNQGGHIKVSPIRRIAHEQHLEKKRYLLFNFLFFLTTKISMLYNQIRQYRPHEQISITSGHMDYMYDNKEDTIETFPLYNKACIGLTHDGTFKFLNKQLHGGRIMINGHDFRWENDCVNTKESKAVKVYTPYLSVDEACEDYSKYAVEVGHGRLNVVIVNDQIVAMRMGNVLLPPIGVVVSLDQKMGEVFLKEEGLEEQEQGYYNTEKLCYKLILDREETISYQWIYGGGLSIIKDGVNLFKNKTIGEKILREEGWLSPLSMQTQESNIHELSRHPRTAFGMTKKQEFFGIVFSGRTRENAGVNYIEMAEIAQKEFGPIHCMVNVDGGASSLLALIEDKELFELNYPGASPTSTAGMARPINSMMIMEI